MEKKQKNTHHGNTFVPPYTISFPEEEFITTNEILEELGIKYQTLASRIKRNNFPAPEQRGMNGREALYRRSHVLKWLDRNGFKIE